MATWLEELKAFVDTLEDRLTAARAGYLDELAAANLPTDVSGVRTVVDGLQTDLDNASDGLGALKILIDAIPTTMVGTNNAALASAWTAALATALGNYTAARAGYLDQLDFALQEAIAALQTDLDNPSQYKADLSTLETRLSAVRAGYLDQLDFNLQEAIAAIPTTMVGTDNAALASVLEDAMQKATGPAYNQDTDSLEALRELLDAIAGYITTEIADILTDTGTTLPGLLATIQADLDNPTQYMANLTTLETRLSAVRAGYLDELDFALQEAIAAIPTTMVGTNNAALASVLEDAMQKATGPAYNQDTDSLEALRERLDTMVTSIAALQTDLDNPSQYKADLSTLETRLSAVRAGYLDQLDFNLQEAIAASAGGGSIGLSYKGTVTTYTDTTHFKDSSLAGYGNDFFRGYFVYVVRDAGGAGAAPQFEQVEITDYVSSDGTFTHDEFTTQLAENDEVLVLLLPVAVGNMQASDSTLASALTDRSNNTTSYVLVKEYRVPRDGTYRIKWNQRTSNNAQTAYSQVWKNGAPVGAVKSTNSETDVAVEEDIGGFAHGDLLQIYAKTAFAANQSYVNSVRICGSTFAFIGKVTQD